MLRTLVPMSCPDFHCRYRRLGPQPCHGRTPIRGRFTMLKTILISLAVIVIVFVVIVALQPSGLPRRPEHYHLRPTSCGICSGE